MTKNLIIQENLADDVSKNKLNILYNLPTETKIEIMRKRAVIKKDKKYTDEESLNYIDTINDIIKQFLEHEKVHVTYKFSKACKDHGRLYANTGISRLPADFRNYLIKDKFHDIDIVNAVPTILKYLNDTIIKANCPYLDKYIKNRDKTLKKYNLSKYDVIGWIFRGWEYEGNNKFLQCFNNEILNIQNKVFDNENFKNVTKNQLKKDNKKGGFLSRVLFYYENVILNDAIDKLKKKKYISPHFDF